MYVRQAVNKFYMCCKTQPQSTYEACGTQQLHAYDYCNNRKLGNKY